MFHTLPGNYSEIFCELYLENKKQVPDWPGGRQAAPPMRAQRALPGGLRGAGLPLRVLAGPSVGSARSRGLSPASSTDRELAAPRGPTALPGTLASCLFLT